MACDPQTFTVTPDQYSALQVQVAKAGLVISGDSGQDSYKGCTVSWLYDPTAQTLTMQCLSKPFFVSCGYVNGKIKEWVSGIS